MDFTVKPLHSIALMACWAMSIIVIINGESRTLELCVSDKCCIIAYKVASLLIYLSSALASCRHCRSDHCWDACNDHRGNSQGAPSVGSSYLFFFYQSCVLLGQHHHIYLELTQQHSVKGGRDDLSYLWLAMDKASGFSFRNIQEYLCPAAITTEVASPIGDSLLDG
jgi:hypothetical protein